MRGFTTCWVVQRRFAKTVLAQLRNRSESRDEFAYREQISLFMAKLPLICSTPCNNQPRQLLTCSPLCSRWLGNGRRGEIRLLPALRGTAGVHTLDRQTGRRAPLSKNKRVACSLRINELRRCDDEAGSVRG